MKQSVDHIRLVFEIVLAAAVAELLVMKLIPMALPSSTGWLEAGADAMLLAFILGPLVWWRSVCASQRSQQAEPAHTPLPHGSSLGLSMAVLVSGVLISIWAGYRTGSTIEAQARERFERINTRLEHDLRQRFAMPLFGLRGAHGTHNANGHINRQAFRNYVRSIGIDQQFPGVRGFGYIVQVARPDLAVFERQERADQAAHFQVKTSGHADDLYVIKMIEPIAGNQAALGYDVGSEPVRRAALEAAIGSGQPTLSGPITLIQDQLKRPALLYLLPLYQGETAPGTAAERRASLVGVYYAPIVMDELMQGVFDVGDRQLNITLSDQTPAEAVELFTAQGPEASEFGQGFVQSRTLSIAGRQFMLRTQGNATFERLIDRASPSWVVLGGTLLSGLLALATWLMASARARTEARAASMTADLDRLAEVVKRTSNAVMITDAAGLITWVNEGFTRLYGYTLAEAQGRILRELVNSPACPPDKQRTVDQAIERGEACRVQLLNRDKSGQTFWIDTEIQPRRGPHGELIGFIEIAQNITDLKDATRRLEDALRETDALLRTLNVHAIVSVTDRTGRIIEVNDAFCTISGYSRAELLGSKHNIVNSGVQDKAFWTQMWQTIAAGQPWRGEVCNRAKDGALYWVDSVVAPFMDAEGRITKYISIRHDVTRRKLTEQQLRSSQAFMDRASRIAGVGGWQIDLRTDEMEWSDQACLIHDLAPGFKTTTEFGLFFLAPGSRARVQAAISAAIQHGTAWDMEVEAVTAQGRPIWLRSLGEAEFENGHAVRVVGTSQDITERRESRVRLRDTTTLLTNVLNAAEGIAVIAVNPARQITVFNTGAERLLGYRAADLVGKQTPQIFHEPDDPHRLHIDPAWLGRARELNYVRHDGSRVPVSQVITEMRSEQGELTGYLGIVQDRTQRLAYETSLQQAKQEAEQASAAKGEFLANMSHEIRTPMNAILGMLRLLQKTPLDARQLDYARKTERAAQSLLALLNDILDFSKVEAGKMALHAHPFALEQLMRDLGVILSANLSEHKPVSLRFELDPTLPAHLIGDDLRLQQVLINLGGNAIKFTHQGEVVVALSVLAREPDRVRLRVSVRDTGIGIAPEALDRIFEGFSQAESTTTRQYGGTGLGLAISQRLVDLMDSQLCVRSEPGQGSTFWFDLSLALPDASALPAESGEAATPLALRPPTPPRRLAGWRVLLVEDNPNNRQVASELLYDEGAEVTTAQNGEEGIRAVLNGPDLIDVVLMDVQMPVKDGLSAAAELNAQLGPRTPPIIAMTANARPSDIAASRAAGMVAHIGKPFDLNQLVSTIRQHGRLHRTPASPASATPPHGTPPLDSADHAARLEAQTQGVNLSEALNRLGGRQDVYLKLLRPFLADLAGASEQALRWWAQGDIPALAAWLHSFKGLSATLGHDALSQAASAAEQACPPQVDDPATPAWLTALTDQIELARARLPALLAALAPPPLSPAAPSIPLVLDTALLHQQGEELIKLLTRSDMNAVDLHARLHAAHAAVLGDTLIPLNEAMAQLDFASAIGHCQRLMAPWPQE